MTIEDELNVSPNSALSRRRFLKLVGAGAGTVAAGSVLAACGGSSASGSKASKRTLVVWYWGEQEAPGMQSFMKAAVAAYQKKNPNITVQAVLQQSDTLYSAFRTAAKAGVGPDIQYFWGGTQALEDVWMGHVAPLDEYIDKSWLAKIPLGARRETYWNGHQWGLPFYQIGSAWAYNKKMFASAGLDPNSPPTTWATFMDACSRLKAKGITPIGSGYKDAYLGGWLVSYMGQQNFNSVDDAIAPFKHAVPYAGPKYTEWLNRLGDMINKGYFNKDIMSLNLYQGQNLFQNEQAAMTNSVQPQLVSFERKMGKDTAGVMLTPAFGTGTFAHSVGAPVQVLTITSFSKQKHLAADFLKFLHTDDMMKLMYARANAVSPDTRFKAAWLNTQVDAKFMQWTKTMPNFWYQYYYPFAFEGLGVMPATQAMFTGNATPAQAVQTIQQGVHKWRSQHADEVRAYKKWELLA
jgi:raffinose/stachyose/melibiose transport system substrate-binding protein